MNTLLLSAAHEVTELHAFLEAWFRGQVPKTEAAFKRLSFAWPDTLRLISPDHQVLEASALLAKTYEEHAAYPNLRIEVRHRQCILATDQNLAFVVYEERHIERGSIDSRFCSAVLAELPTSELVWLHIHESRVVSPDDAI